MAAAKQGDRPAGACARAADGSRGQAGQLGAGCGSQPTACGGSKEGAGGGADPRVCVWAEDPDATGTARDAMWRRIHEVLSKRRRRGGQRTGHVCAGAHMQTISLPVGV